MSNSMAQYIKHLDNFIFSCGLNYNIVVIYPKKMTLDTNFCG